MQLTGLDAGCSPTLIPGGGLINIPNFGTHHKRNRMTAMALVHRPTNDLWTQYTTSREKIAREPAPIRKAGFNFAAPGDRVDAAGVLWLHVSSRQSNGASYEPKKEVDWVRAALAEAAGESSASGDVAWIADSAGEGASRVVIPAELSDSRRKNRNDATRRYDVRLVFLEPRRAAGERVQTIKLEGRAVLTDLDIAKEAGGAGKPLVREFKGVEVTGPLDIELSASRGKTLLSGVEIRLSE